MHKTSEPSSVESTRSSFEARIDWKRIPIRLHAATPLEIPDQLIEDVGLRGRLPFLPGPLGKHRTPPSATVGRRRAASTSARGSERTRTGRGSSGSLRDFPAGPGTAAPSGPPGRRRSVSSRRTDCRATKGVQRPRSRCRPVTARCSTRMASRRRRSVGRTTRPAPASRPPMLRWPRSARPERSATGKRKEGTASSV